MCTWHTPVDVSKGRGPAEVDARLAVLQQLLGRHVSKGSDWRRPVLRDRKHTHVCGAWCISLRRRTAQASAEGSQVARRAAWCTCRKERRVRGGTALALALTLTCCRTSSPYRLKNCSCTRTRARTNSSQGTAWQSRTRHTLTAQQGSCGEGSSRWSHRAARGWWVRRGTGAAAGRCRH